MAKTSDVFNRLRGWIICRQCGKKHNPKKSSFISCLWAAFTEAAKNNNFIVDMLYPNKEDLTAKGQITIHIPKLRERLFLTETREKCRKDLPLLSEDCPIYFQVSIKTILQSKNPTAAALNCILENPTNKVRLMAANNVARSIKPGGHWWAGPGDKLSFLMEEVKEVIGLYQTIGGKPWTEVVAAEWEDKYTVRRLILKYNDIFLKTDGSSIEKISKREKDLLVSKWRDLNRKLICKTN